MANVKRRDNVNFNVNVNVNSNLFFILPLLIFFFLFVIQLFVVVGLTTKLNRIDKNKANGLQTIICLSSTKDKCKIDCNNNNTNTHILHERREAYTYSNRRELLFDADAITPNPNWFS